MIRVLVTGSRDWADEGVILSDLMMIDALRRGEGVTLVHGHCPSGADRMADTMARGLGWYYERHPAEWSLGRRAGFIRNEMMVSLGAHVCLAYIRAGSKGATMTADLAQKAGITTIRRRCA